MQDLSKGSRVSGGLYLRRSQRRAYICWSVLRSDQSIFLNFTHILKSSLNSNIRRSLDEYYLFQWNLYNLNAFIVFLSWCIFEFRVVWNTTNEN